MAVRFFFTGGGVQTSVTLRDRGEGVKNGQKKRYVIAEQPLIAFGK